MGTTNYVYVGTYAVLTIPETKTSYNRHGCVQKDCKRVEKIQGGTYCSSCGNKLGTFKIEVLEHMHPSEFLDEYDEDIFLYWMEGFDIPNNQYIAMINEEIPQIAINIDTYEDGTTEFSIPDRENSIFTFCKKYQKQLQQFKDFGVKVEIKFGIVNYYL